MPQSPEAHRKSLKKHYEANKQEYLDRNAVVRAAKREWIRAYKDRPCTDCGIKYPYYVMDLDHRDPSQKLFNPAILVVKG